MWRSGCGERAGDRRYPHLRLANTPICLGLFRSLGDSLGEIMRNCASYSGWAGKLKKFKRSPPQCQPICSGGSIRCEGSTAAAWGRVVDERWPFVFRRAWRSETGDRYHRKARCTVRVARRPGWALAVNQVWARPFATYVWRGRGTESRSQPAPPLQDRQEVQLPTRQTNFRTVLLETLPAAPRARARR